MARLQRMAERLLVVHRVGVPAAVLVAHHISAPHEVARDPTAVLLSGVMMLKYLGEFAAAADIEHAVLVMLMDGRLTGDIVGYDKGVKTSEFAGHVIANLGRRAQGWSVRPAKPIQMPQVGRNPVFRPAKTKDVVGADIFERSIARRNRHLARGDRGHDAA